MWLIVEDVAEDDEEEEDGMDIGILDPIVNIEDSKPEDYMDASVRSYAAR